MTFMAELLVSRRFFIYMPLESAVARDFDINEKLYAFWASVTSKGLSSGALADSERARSGSHPG
jgi:hypothetical protein